MKHIALAAVAALSVAACAAPGGGLDPLRDHGNIPVPDFAGDVAGDETACGAPHMGYLVGQPVSEVDLASLARTVRPIAPGDLVTEDYRPERVNLDLDADGVILRVWCG